MNKQLRYKQSPEISEEEKPIIEFPTFIWLGIIFISLCLALSLLVLPWHFVLFLFLGLCVGLAIFFNTYIGLLLFLVAAVLHPGSFISEAYGLFYLSRYLAIGVLFIWLFHTMVYKDFKIIKAKQNLFLLGFALLILLSFVSSKEYSIYFGEGFAAQHLFDYLKLFILYFLIANLIKTKRQFFIFVWSLIFLGNISCFIGIHQYINKIGMFYGTPFLRISGTAGDPNYFALHLVMLIPLVVALFLNSKSIVTKGYLIGFSVLLLLNILFTYSRGGAVGLVIVLFLSFFMLVLHNRKKVLPIFIMILIILIFVAFIPEQYWLRLKTIPNLREGAIIARLDTWRAGYEMILEHPFIGVGIGNFRWEYYLKAISSPYIKTISAMVAHNTFIEIAAESGILALVFFLLLIFWTLRDLRRAAINFRNKADTSLYTISRALIISIIGYGICGMFLSQQYLVMFWIIIPLAITMKQFYLTENEENK